ncbi:predicted permease, DMT superfamily [Anaerolinea thermolimosa]|uniref:DMT family transporter n=1 Tax=Anaerolinea thermolimosa TaxID=229919 RepID=UPI0009FC62E4|nr:DMT family transporter [Anaerolinea thermolimosa]GAP06627.1 predicted permease, DMT superfamily [Anaerolinea thermolimosa]
MDTTTTMTRNQTKGYVIALVGTFIWSTTAILIRHLTNQWHLPPIILAFWRDFFVFLILVLILGFFRRSLLFTTRSTFLYLLIYGLVLAVFNFTWTLSVYYNGAAVSTVLAYSSAAFTAVLGWRFLNENLGGAKILAVGFSLTGCILVSGAASVSAWALNPLGIVTGLISGMAFAIYSLFGRQASRRGIPSLTTLTYTFGTAAGFLLLFNMVEIPGYSGIRHLFWLENSLVGWGFLILLAFGPTIGGYGLYTVSLGYLPASVANLIATLEPALTAVQAYLFLGERLTSTQLAGSILILGGVIFLRWSEQRVTARQILPSGTTPQ